MQVIFRTNKLERCYLESRQAIRTWGDGVGRRYIERINIIQATTDIDELCRLPGLYCHPLKQNREGQYAITLIGRWRLIVTRCGEQLELVRVEEVSKHYDD